MVSRKRNSRSRTIQRKSMKRMKRRTTRKRSSTRRKRRTTRRKKRTTRRRRVIRRSIRFPMNPRKRKKMIGGGELWEWEAEYNDYGQFRKKLGSGAYGVVFEVSPPLDMAIIDSKILPGKKLPETYALKVNKGILD